MIITKRMKEPTNQSSSWKYPLAQPTVQSQMLIGPALPQDPGSDGPAAPATKWEA